MAPLAIELLGIPAVLLRLFSRWRYTAGYEIDDWIMVACLPIFIVFEVVGHICMSPPPPTCHSFTGEHTRFSHAKETQKIWQS